MSFFMTRFNYIRSEIALPWVEYKALRQFLMPKFDQNWSNSAETFWLPLSLMTSTNLCVYINKYIGPYVCGCIYSLVLSKLLVYQHYLLVCAIYKVVVWLRGRGGRTFSINCAKLRFEGKVGHAKCTKHRRIIYRRTVWRRSLMQTYMSCRFEFCWRAGSGAHLSDSPRCFCP